MIMVLGTHFTRASDIVVPDHLTDYQSFRADHAVSRWVRQPVQPYRCTGRYHVSGR
jgi:hypothetical protein